MKRVESSGLFHYEVVGENEALAAEELENLYWHNWMRIGFPDVYSQTEALNRIAKKYGVTISCEGG